MLVVALLPVMPLAAETVSLPLSLPYSILESLVGETVFNGPGHTLELRDVTDACRHVTLSRPAFSQDGQGLHLEARAAVVLGASLAGNCVTPFAWHGYVAFTQHPVLLQNWGLVFETRDVVLYDHDHHVVTGTAWNLVKSLVAAAMHRIELQLAPPVSEFKSFILPFFPDDLRKGTQRMLDSMRPGRVRVMPDGLHLEILADVRTVYRASERTTREPVSGKALAGLIKVWQTWDVFLVSAIRTLAGRNLSADDRRTLLDALLQTRYEFSAALSTGTLKRGFVRTQFIRTWKKIRPLFTHYLQHNPAGTRLGYLAFFSATQALEILDKVGPTMGIEISRNGLIRLARLLDLEDAATLAYRPEIDAGLRQVLGLEALPDAVPAPTGKDKRRRAPQEGRRGSSLFSPGRLWRTGDFFAVANARAAKKPNRSSLADLKKWMIRPDHLKGDVRRVRQLLNSVIRQRLRKNKIAARYHDLFRRTVLATAWQESCYRQFIVKDRRITFLRSYNGSSVGLMQINERVWRGIYALSRLRWNIRYNAGAGCDILALYLTRYVLRNRGRRRAGHQTGSAYLSGFVYALYNGGPRELQQYPQRRRRRKWFTSDRLYREKFEWVSAGRWDRIRSCLAGG